MDKESKAYKCGRYNEFFEAADSAMLACEDTVAYERDLRVLEEMNAGALYAAEVAREEGREEGREARTNEIVRLLYTSGMPSEKIADALCIPLHEIERILDI